MGNPDNREEDDFLAHASGEDLSQWQRPDNADEAAKPRGMRSFAKRAQIWISVLFGIAVVAGFVAQLIARSGGTPPPSP